MENDQDETPFVPVDALPLSVRPLFPYRQFNAMQSRCVDVAYCSDRHLVLSAPTGSGKTAVLEMCLARLWSSEAWCAEARGSRAAAVYIAPLKALTAERLDDWRQKLAGSEIQICELTGDAEADQEAAAERADLIVATPEKWDAFTRFRRSAHSVLARVSLVLVDEIHLLADESRGPTLEAVIARMKLHAQSPDTRTCPIASLRLVGVSATIANLEDIGAWFGPQCAILEFDSAFRPVPLSWHVLSWQMNITYRFDEELRRHVFQVVRSHCNSRPTMVFFNSRENAAKGAEEVARQAGGVLVQVEKTARALGVVASRCADHRLAEQLRRGVGHHHAGLSTEDKRLVEGAFRAGELPILCSTVRLAQGACTRDLSAPRPPPRSFVRACSRALHAGVNLPAHLVVLCNTCRYIAGGFKEYSQMDVLQMAGRAGRPQFDTSGTCVVMCRAEQSQVYRKMLAGECTIESELQKQLPAHLNSEIASQLYMSSTEAAAQWLRATYLFARVRKNPARYGIVRGLAESELEGRLVALCANKLRELADSGMIEMTDDPARGGAARVRPRNLGYLMARFCVEMETMTLFPQLSATASLPDVLSLLSTSKELGGGLALRTIDKKPLAAINASEEKIRFPIDGSRKSKCKTPASKAFLLLQLRASGAPLEGFDDTRILMQEKGCRVLRAMIEYAESAGLSGPLCAAVRLHKSLSSGAGWHDAPTAAFRQFTGVGAQTAARLSEASQGSLQAFGQLTSLRVDQVAPRASSHLAEARTLLRSELRLVADVERAGPSREGGGGGGLRVSIRVGPVSSPTAPLTPALAGSVRSRWRLVIADYEGRLLLSRKLSTAEALSSPAGALAFSFSVPPASARHHLEASLLNLDCFGIDLDCTITLPGATDVPLPPAAPSARAKAAPKGRKTAAAKARPGGAAGGGGGGAGGGRTAAAAAAQKPPPAFDILAALDFEDSDDDDEGARAAGPVGGSASLDPDADLFGEAPRRLQPRDAGPTGDGEASEAAPCGHLCKDKQACGHLCCKQGLRSQRNRAAHERKRPQPTASPPAPQPAGVAFLSHFRAATPKQPLMAPAMSKRPKPAPGVPSPAESRPGESDFGFSSDGVHLRDGSTAPAAARSRAVAEREPARVLSSEREGASGGRHIAQLQARARSVPSTPVRLPIAPLPDSLEPPSKPSASRDSPATTFAPAAAGRFTAPSGGGCLAAAAPAQSEAWRSWRDGATFGHQPAELLPRRPPLRPGWTPPPTSEVRCSSRRGGSKSRPPRRRRATCRQPSRAAWPLPTRPPPSSRRARAARPPPRPPLSGAAVRRPLAPEEASSPARAACFDSDASTSGRGRKLHRHRNRSRHRRQRQRRRQWRRRPGAHGPSRPPRSTPRR